MEANRTIFHRDTAALSCERVRPTSYTEPEDPVKNRDVLRMWQCNISLCVNNEMIIDLEWMVAIFKKKKTRHRPSQSVVAVSSYAWTKTRLRRSAKNSSNSVEGTKFERLGWGSLPGFDRFPRYRFLGMHLKQSRIEDVPPGIGPLDTICYLCEGAPDLAPLEMKHLSIREYPRVFSMLLNGWADRTNYLDARFVHRPAIWRSSVWAT